MYRFYIGQDQIQEDEIHILDSDVNHIRNVLRLEPGDWLVACDGEGTDYVCRIQSLSPDDVTLSIEKKQESGTELDTRITLFQGIPKKDKMEFIIQKCVELGVTKIVPVDTDRAVVKLDAKKEEAKRKRWYGISESAAKQSKRTVIPQIQMPLSWKQALEEAKELDVVLVPYENERGMEATREIFRSIPEGASIGVMIGPEGGFSPEEIAQLDKDMHRISLGRRILRTETAGMATLSMLIYELDI